MRSLVLIVACTSLLTGEPAALHIKSAAAAYQAGQTATQNRQFKDAIDSFHKAIEIEPTFTDAFDGLINAYLISGQRSQAAAIITQLLEIEPNLTASRLLLGQILMEQNQAERALAQFSFVLKADPANADALLGLAAAARRMGMENNAAEALEKGRKQYPGDSRFKTAPR